jgi:hypothetical protein
MSDHYWFESEKHPPTSVLLLHLEEELEGRESSAVIEHMVSCWGCRVRLEELQEGIHTFINYRRDVLLPSLPAPPSSRHNFPRRLQIEKAGRPTSSKFRGLVHRIRAGIALRPQAAWVSGFVSVVMVAVFLIVYLMQAPVMSAAQFLGRVRMSEYSQTVSLKRVICQKVQLRQGGRVIERKVVRSANQQVKEQSQPDPEWTRLLARTPIDWQDPLGVDRFESWRNAQGGTKDSVSESNDAVTLTTTPLSHVEVQWASLTVRGSDWHPIAKHVEFSNEPSLEVREVSFEVREESAPEAPVALSPPHVGTAAVAGREAVSAAPPALTASPELEVEVLSLLETAGADLGEQLSLVRTAADTLRLEGIVETSERRQEILQTLKPVLQEPALSVAITSADEVTEESSNSAFPSGPVRVVEVVPSTDKIPVERDLREFFSKTVPADKLDGEITRYSNQVLTQSSESLQHAWAIMRLVERFSPAEKEKMKSATQAKWLAMIQEHARNLEQQNGALRSSLLPVFSPSDTTPSPLEAVSIGGEVDLTQTAKRLFDLCFSNWEVVRSSFTLSNDRALTPRIRAPEFWRSLDQAQRYARRIQQSTSTSKK